MEKQGRLEPGKTPSEISGLPSELIKEGQVIRKEETSVENTVEKVAALMAE